VRLAALAFAATLALPASVLVLALAPDMLIGWTRAFKPDEAQWIAPNYAQLPEFGRLTGRGNTANVEVVLKAKPDLIVDMGSTSATFASLATVLGVPQQGHELADYAKRLIDGPQRKIAAVPRDKRPQVYYARGRFYHQEPTGEQLTRLLSEPGVAPR
jgi:iron complex transport system substrate-binding protein